MKEVNYPLRKAYITKLSGLEVNTIPIPVYYMEAPETETGQAYILLVSPSSSNVSTFSTSDTVTNMQLQIHTWAEDGNSGKLTDDIAAAVFNLVTPNTQAVLDLSADGIQMVSLKLDRDRVNSITGLGNREYVTRILDFSHNIFHK